MIINSIVKILSKFLYVKLFIIYKFINTIDINYH